MVALLRESIASARSQPVASALTVLVTAGMVMAVMLSTGRAVGAEQRVLSTFDDAGTRSIVIRAEPGAGITSDVLVRIGSIGGIEWSGAFSAAADASNALVPGGPRVPVRQFYSADPGLLGIPPSIPIPGALAYTSHEANVTLGAVDGVGGLVAVDGMTYGIAGTLSTPSFLEDFEPLVVVPQPSPTGAEPIAVIVVVADSPEVVSSVAAGVVSVLGSDDSAKVSIQTSEALAQLRALVQYQLSSFSRGLVLALLGLTILLVGVLLYGLVLLRRKDFGRRRALGATRSLIVTMLLAQTGALALLGALCGLTASAVALLISGDPMPGVAFTTALGVIAVAAAMLAALVPALIASRREPIRELRVP